MITRQQAKELGLSRFFTAEPCTRGHVSERYVVNRGCVACQKENLDKWRQGQPERARELSTKHSRKRYELKRDIVLQEQAVWRRNNPEATRRHWKNVYDNGGKEKRVAYALEYAKKHPEKVKAWRAKWMQANKSTLNEARRRYQAQRTRSMPSWANPEAIRQFYAIAVMLSKETGISHHVDHIIPIKGKYVCGLHVEHNLQVITWLENTRKGNRMPSDEELAQAINNQNRLDK